MRKDASDSEDSDSDSSDSTTSSESDGEGSLATSFSVPLPHAAPVPFQRTMVIESDDGSSDSESEENSSDTDDSSQLSNHPVVTSDFTSSVMKQQETMTMRPDERSSSSDSDIDSDHGKELEKKTISTVNGNNEEEDNKSTGMKKKPFWSAKPIVFVKGLPFSTSLIDIKKFFGDCGKIIKVDRQFDDNKRWTGSIFIKFDSVASVEQALAMNGKVWSGSGGDGKRFVTVDKHDQKKSAKRREKVKKGGYHGVFIGNLQKTVKKQEVQDLFVECGTISGIRFAKDPNGECRGFGYVEFDNEDGKNKALTMNRKLTLDGKLLQVRKAQNNKKKKKRENKKENILRSNPEKKRSVANVVGGHTAKKRLKAK